MDPGWKGVKKKNDNNKKKTAENRPVPRSVCVRWGAGGYLELAHVCVRVFAEENGIGLVFGFCAADRVQAWG